MGVYLPPMKEVLYSKQILIAAIAMVVAIIVLIVLSRRASVKEKHAKRNRELSNAIDILRKRNVDEKDIIVIDNIFKKHKHIRPESAILVFNEFTETLKPLLTQELGKREASLIQFKMFPPPKDTRRIGAEEALKNNSPDGKVSAEELAELVRQYIQPGLLVEINFLEKNKVYKCTVLNSDVNGVAIEFTDQKDYRILEELTIGMPIEGSFEDGTLLMAFSSTITEVILAKTPYFITALWTDIWQVRHRETIRLPVSIPVEFKYMSPGTSQSVRLSDINYANSPSFKGSIRNIGLGGCCIETDESSQIKVSDFISFSATLVQGQPPVNLFASVVSLTKCGENSNTGSTKCRLLHLKFLVLDDVSQRFLAKAIYFLQKQSEQEDWERVKKATEKSTKIITAGNED